MEKERIVIIGSNGVIWRKLRESIIALKIPFLALRRNDLDLLNPLADNNLTKILEEGDKLIFLAGITPEKGNDLDTLYKNIRMVQPIITAAKNKNIAQVIYLSSDSVYQSIETKIREDSPILPLDCYSMMHLVREGVLANSIGKKLCILRCTQVFSLNDTHLAYGPSRFISEISANNKVNIYGTGDDSRDHIYIDDLVSAILQVVKINLHGKYILGSGYSTSFIGIAKKIIEIYDDIPSITWSPQKIDKKNRNFDNTLLKNQLNNWNPRNIYEALEDVQNTLKSKINEK